MARRELWRDAFAFLLLTTTAVAIGILLLATQRSYSDFRPIGKGIAWLVALGAVTALASLTIVIIRLYLHPLVGRARRLRKPNS